MSRDEQIEEMAKDLEDVCENRGCNYENGIRDCDKCRAEWLYELGYRKASEVAREMREELVRYIMLNENIAIKCKKENGEWNEEYWKGKLSAFKQIRAYIDAELKKKYTEGGE